MLTLNDAREQFLSQIELQLCRIYEAGSEVHNKLREFYDHIAELPLNHFIFNWYLINYENIQIEVVDKEVRIFKTNDSDSERSIDNIAMDDLIIQVFDNQN